MLEIELSPLSKLLLNSLQLTKNAGNYDYCIFIFPEMLVHIFALFPSLHSRLCIISDLDDFTKMRQLERCACTIFKNARVEISSKMLEKFTLLHIQIDNDMRLLKHHIQPVSQSSYAIHRACKNS